jgi:hypothetical protein
MPARIARDGNLMTADAMHIGAGAQNSGMHRHANDHVHGALLLVATFSCGE